MNNEMMTTWSWSASWFGSDVKFNERLRTPLGFSVEFDGDILSFTASGAREGDFESDGNVGTMMLGFQNLVGDNVSPGMENFFVEVENLGYLGAQTLNKVEIEIDEDLGGARLARSSFTNIFVGGDTGKVTVSASFAITAEFGDDVEMLRSINSFFGEYTVGGETDLLIDRGGISNTYYTESMDVGRFIGGGFNFLSAGELDHLLVIRDSVLSTFFAGTTDDGARVRLVRGADNYLEIAESGDNVVIAVIGGQGNVVRVGDGDVRYNVHLTEPTTTAKFNISIIGGEGDETFNIVGDQAGGAAVLKGGDGNDTFMFRAGTASVYACGGEGGDSFTYMGGNVVIEDYEAGVDTLTIDFDNPISVSFNDNGDGTMTVSLIDQIFLG